MYSFVTGLEMKDTGTLQTTTVDLETLTDRHLEVVVYGGRYQETRPF